MTLIEAIERHVQHLWDADSPDTWRDYTHNERFFVRWLEGEGSRFGLPGDSDAAQVNNREVFRAYKGQLECRRQLVKITAAYGKKHWVEGTERRHPNSARRRQHAIRALFHYLANAHGDAGGSWTRCRTKPVLSLPFEKKEIDEDDDID